MKVTLCGLSTMRGAQAGPGRHTQARRGLRIASFSAALSEVARNQIRVRRGIVVSCLQQSALFALATKCVPGIDHDRRNDGYRPPVVCEIEVAQGITGTWWLYFRRGGELAGVAIIEAPMLYHARTRVAVRGIGKAAEYSDGKELDDEDAALVPPTCIGGLLLAEEARQLSDQLCVARAEGARRSVERGG
jgi:hypothetical protein